MTIVYTATAGQYWRWSFKYSGTWRMRAQERNRRSLQRAVALTLTTNKKGALARALNDGVDPPGV